MRTGFIYLFSIFGRTFSSITQYIRTLHTDTITHKRENLIKRRKREREKKKNEM
jgi:hypothetical protein